MSKKSYLIFFTACLILVVALFFYKNSFSKVNAYNAWVNHTAEVIFAFDTLANDVKSLEILPFYRIASQSSRVPEHLYENTRNIPRDITRLKHLTRDNKLQLRRLDTLSALLNPVGGLPGMNDYTLVRQVISNGIVTENALLSERKAILESSTYTTGWLVVIFTATSIVLIIGISVSNIYHISRRKKAERFLQSVLNTSQNAIITMVAVRSHNVITDFRFIFANDSVEKQTGFRPAELVGKTVLTISPAVVGKGMMQRYIEVCETGLQQEFENYFEHQSTARWYNVTLSKLNDGITATLYDITELKNYHVELQQKVRQLEQTNNELEQFAYVASHDLQEPLRKIKTFASMINERSAEPAESFLKVYLGKIIHSANRMSNLISDLLNLTDLSKQQGSFTHTSLNAILQHVLDDFELVIREKDAVVTVGVLPELEAIPLQMNQLFYNLLNNALKFTHAHTPPVISITSAGAAPEEIRQHRLRAALSYCRITVTDNGIGFESEYAEKIFTIFQRLNNKSLYSGSGIGLALCRKIVKNHHGEIIARSKKHEGTSFHVFLPLHQPASHSPVADTVINEK